MHEKEQNLHNRGNEKGCDWWNLLNRVKLDYLPAEYIVGGRAGAGAGGARWWTSERRLPGITRGSWELADPFCDSRWRILAIAVAAHSTLSGVSGAGSEALRSTTGGSGESAADSESPLDFDCRIGSDRIANTKQIQTNRKSKPRQTEHIHTDRHTLADLI